MPSIEQIQKFLRDDPTDSFLLYSLAIEYTRQNVLQEALKSFETLASTDPAYLPRYYHHGKLCESLEQFDAAASLYRAGVELARQQNDDHAASELAGALSMLEMLRDD